MIRLLRADEIECRVSTILTKGPTITCTVFHADGKQFSWYWGFDGYMLVSPQVAAMGRLIQACIERDFHIPCKQ